MRELFPNIFEPEVEQKIHIGAELVLNTNGLIEDGLESEEEDLSRNSDELQFQEMDVEDIKKGKLQVSEELQKITTRRDTRKSKVLDGSRIIRPKDDENHSMIQPYLNQLYGSF